MTKTSSEIADYLNNYENRRRFMQRVKTWATIFFFVTYGYLLTDKVRGLIAPGNVQPPCNTATAIDSVMNHYQYKLDSVVKTKQNKKRK
jgi:hypothetical protein